MAVGNTFGATALSSYGGFWISFALILTPGLNIVTALGGVTSSAFLDSMGFFLMGWFIFTTILLFCTLRSTVMFFLLFFWLDLAFLMLGIGWLKHSGGAPDANFIKAGGLFGLLAAFWAWYNAWAGIADSSNRYVFKTPLQLGRCSYMVASGLFPSCTSHGQIRLVSDAERLTTLWLAILWFKRPSNLYNSIQIYEKIWRYVCNYPSNVVSFLDIYLYFNEFSYFEFLCE
jgi:GPR1/FUN34/yaaH family